MEAIWPARSPLRYDEGLCRHIIIPRLHLTAAAPILAGLCAFGLMVDQNRFILLSLGLQIAALIACDELPDGRSGPFFWFRSRTPAPAPFSSMNSLPPQAVASCLTLLWLPLS